MDFELRELQYFVALAEELHFGRAAERVGINQSPLSKAITLMERRMGVQLFVRTRRSTELTAVGEMLLDDARRVLAEAERTRQNMNALACGFKGRLRVAFCTGLAPSVAKVFDQTRKEDPQITLSISQRSLTEQLQELRSGMLDVGLVLSPLERLAVGYLDLRDIALRSQPMMAVIGTECVLAAHSTVAALDASVGPFILIGDASVGAGTLGELIEGSTHPRNPIEFVESAEVFLTRVAAGQGIGLISAEQAETITRPDIVFRPLASRRARITTHLLLRKDRDPPALIARFIERARKML